MRSATEVLAAPDLAVRRVTCAEDRGGWSEPEVPDAVHVVLVRSGTFRMAGAGRRTFTLDRFTGYVEMPGQERAFAHPAGGDVCTAITVSDGWWAELTDGRPVPPAVHVDGRLDVLHRRLLLAGDRFTALDEFTRLLARALREQALPVTAGPGRRALADRARDALLSDASLQLVSLARALGVSPAHLSRTFRHHMGLPLAAFRNRVRAARALDSLESGADLATVAADLGFADQSHLTRVMKAETGLPPGALRRLMRRGPALHTSPASL